jgi:hypothetical protein
MRWRVLRRPELLVVAAIAAVWLPGTLSTDLRNIRGVGLPPHPPKVVGAAVKKGTNLQLVQAAAVRIPSHDDFGIVFGGRWQPHVLGGGYQLAREAGASWTQYTLAPRFAVVPGSAQWLILRDVSPQALGLHPTEAVRFGQDWLVRLR